MFPSLNIQTIKSNQQILWLSIHPLKTRIDSNENLPLPKSPKILKWHHVLLISTNIQNLQSRQSLDDNIPECYQSQTNFLHEVLLQIKYLLDDQNDQLHLRSLGFLSNSKSQTASYNFNLLATLLFIFLFVFSAHIFQLCFKLSSKFCESSIRSFFDLEKMNMMVLLSLSTRRH